jgi:hypothetical protein
VSEKKKEDNRIERQRKRAVKVQEKADKEAEQERKKAEKNTRSSPNFPKRQASSFKSTT